MINGSIKNDFLALLVGNSNQMITGGMAYICLGYDVATDANDNITRFDEPTQGYSRYMIGYYNQSYTKKIDIAGGVASNKDTLYFDEAEADWTTEDHKLKYFGIAFSETGLPIAYGHIIDPSTQQPTELSVLAHQVPIIKKGQLTLSITDKEELPFDTYYVKVFKIIEDVQQVITEVGKMVVKTTARYISNKDQVAAIAVESISPYVVNLSVGENYLIQNIKQIADNPIPDQYVTLYNNDNTATEYKILVYTTDPDQE